MERPIEIQGLSKSFGETEILKGIDLLLRRGENTVIMGKSGTGKSVLLKCIVGLIIPDTGTIKLYGDDVGEFDERTLEDVRKRIGYLFQGGAIYDSMTVRENLEFPIRRTSKIKDRGKIDNMVMEALENVGLEDSVNKRPSELSGGMRKRLGLARTLILKPDIILYDEPTTGLDPLTAIEISELIIDIQKKYNTSSIIITHDMKCAKITASRIKMLKDGIFYAEGSFDELRSSTDREVRAYFN